jgi:hypothetical protein
VGTTGRFARSLDGGQQQGHQDANDCDHHQKFNQRKSRGDGTVVRNDGS